MVGGGAGFGWGALTDAPPPSSGAPTPVAATGPAYPFTPPVTVLPDPAEPPPLRAPFDTHEVTLGGGPFSVTFPVPRTWTRYNTNPGEVRFVPPGNPSNTHSVRIELVASQTRTPTQMVTLRIADLYDDTRIADLRILDSSEDELTFSFVLSEHRHLSVIRWVSPRGTANAEVEIAATGRMVDRAGLEALVGLISATVHP
jgi:hypothetical protein